MHPWGDPDVLAVLLGIAAHRGPAGYSGSRVEFASSHEAAYVCGNALVLREVQTGIQRFLHGTSFGIEDFAVADRQGLLAVAEKVCFKREFLHGASMASAV